MITSRNVAFQSKSKLSSDCSKSCSQILTSNSAVRPFNPSTFCFGYNENMNLAPNLNL